MSLFGPRYADGQMLDIGGLWVRLKVNARARRISLRVDKVKGVAIAVAPTPRRLADAAAFARSRHTWLADRLAETAPVDPPLAAGDTISVFDVPWTLQPDGRRPRLEAGSDTASVQLIGCGESEVDPGLVIRAIRRQAVITYDQRVEFHCAALGAPKPSLSLIDARTRWGSCTPAGPGRVGSIRLSWRLALAPLAVADYVVAHECAHLLEANHGPRFWAHVRTLVGDEKPHRAWLRRHGASLHAVLAKAAA
jgi:predicted metal-dependent hydrolase